MTTAAGPRRIGFAVLAAAAAWIATLAVYQVDDVFIVYRYAANLARGLGFVFNPGQRVEGVTCFLWTLVLAPFAGSRLPLPYVAPLLTAVAGLLTVALLPGVVARIDGRRSPDAWDWGAAALLAAHPAFAYWSAGGLETVPFTLLLLLALSDQVGEQARGAGRRSALWIGLASLLRPETPIVATALLAGRAIDGPGRSPRERLCDMLLWGGTVALFLIPFLVFRRLYFGDWLPNTYYAKTGLGLMHNLDLGRLYTLPFLASLAPVFGQIGWPGAAIGLALLIALLAWGLPRPGLRSAALLVCGVGAAVLFDGGDWMFLHRFWVPALPPITLLLVSAARALAAHRPQERVLLAAAGVLLAASLVIYGVRQREGANGLRVNAEGYRFAHRRVAAFLKERGRPDDTVALMDVGIIGYESGLRVLDISGLTDRKIARAPGGFLDKRYPVEDLLETSPRFFVLVDGFRIDEGVMRDAGFQARYRLVFARNHRFNWTPRQSYTLHVFERRNDPPTGTNAEPPGPGVQPTTRPSPRGR